MGGSSRPYPRRGQINLDWILILIGVLAGAVMAGAVIRTEARGPESQFGSFVGGLRSLGPSETLVLFEDGASAGEGGWSDGAPNEDHVGLGAIWLVDPGDATLTRRIPLPEGAVRATLRLDLIAIDDWTLHGLEMAVNGRAILRQRFSSRPEMVERQDVEVFGGDGITLRTRLDAPRDLGFQTGTPALADTRLIVELALDTPGRDLELVITPLGPDDTGGEGAEDAPIWAVDNLIVVSTAAP
jgi:hypothetical protein